MPKVVDRPYNDFLAALVAGFASAYGLSEPAARRALAAFCLRGEVWRNSLDHAIADRFTSGEAAESIADDFGLSLDGLRESVARAYLDALLTIKQHRAAYEILEAKVQPMRHLLAEQARRKREAAKEAKAA